MGRGLFVTGTGTDVGKTFVTALMVKKLREHGYDGSYYKAALSGAETGKDGGLIPGDAQFVKMAAGLSEAAGGSCDLYLQRGRITSSGLPLE